MNLVVLDTDVLASASPGGPDRRAQEGWLLLQCLIDRCYFLLASPGLLQEYKKISNLAVRGELSRYFFAKVEPAYRSHDRETRERLERLGVDEKDIEWVLLAAEHEAVFVTWEKYAPRGSKSARREQEHQRVVRAVEDEFGVQIWHPDHALRRLCSKSSRRRR